MTNRLKWLGLMGGVVLACVAFVLILPVGAQDKPGDKQAAAQPAVSEQPAAEPGPFVVPDGTPEELIEYANGLASRRPASQDYQAVAAFRKKLAGALEQTGGKILAGKPDEQQAATGVYLKVLGLSMLSRLDDTDAGKRLKSFPDSLTKAGMPKRARDARFFILQDRFDYAAGADSAELESLVDDIAGLLGQKPFDPSEFQLAMQTAQMLETTRQNSLAAKAYTAFGKTLSESQLKEIAEMGSMMKGAARRLQLVGHKMPLEGATIDGKPLDWSKYKGKTVLVAFWATWCMPCLQEIPNIRKNYDLYHDRGFDVIHISIDEDIDDLRKFLAKNELPWTVLADNLPDDGKKSEPMNVRYGVFGVPTLILVGADGNVVSLSAGGLELGAQLAKTLGPAKPDDEAEAAENAGKKS